MKIKMLCVTMPDGSEWGVPLDLVARDRAENYKSEYDGDIERSLVEDTNPLFEADDYEAEDWAANNMNWSDVEKHAKKLKDPDAPDMQEGWVNGDKEVRTVEVSE